MTTISDKPTFSEVSEIVRRFESFYKLQEKGFFLGLADYIQFIVNNPHLNAVAATIKQIEAEDEKPILILEKQLRRDVKKSEQRIYLILEDNNYDFPELVEAKKEYEGIKNGTIQSSETKDKALYGGLAGIIRALYDKGYKDDVLSFVEVYPDSGYIKRYLISPIYEQYLQELERFRSLRKTQIWGSWDKTALVYLVIHRYDEEIARMESINDFWRRMNFLGLRGEMLEIIDQKKKYRVEFELNEYKLDAQRVHDYFMEKTGGGALLSSIRENIENIQSVIQPTVAATTRLVQDINQISKMSHDAFEVYKRIGTAVVEPLRRLGEFENRVQNAVDAFGSAPINLQPESIIRYQQVSVDVAKKQLVTQQDMAEDIKKIAAVVIPKTGSDDAERVQKRLTKTEAMRMIPSIVKSRALSKKESSLLRILGDCLPHKNSILTEKVPTKDIPHLKKSLDQKISSEGLTVHSWRRGPLEDGECRLEWSMNGKR